MRARNPRRIVFPRDSLVTFETFRTIVGRKSIVCCPFNVHQVRVVIGIHSVSLIINSICLRQSNFHVDILVLVGLTPIGPATNAPVSTPGSAYTCIEMGPPLISRLSRLRSRLFSFSALLLPTQEPWPQVDEAIEEAL